MITRRLSVWELGATTALLGLFTTGVWAELDLLGVGTWALAFTLLGLSYATLRWAGSPPATFEWRRWPSLGYGPGAALLLLPLLIHTLLSWRDEFPFMGDHDHHLMAAHAAFKFWTQAWWALLALPLAIITGLRFGRAGVWPFVVLGLMIAAGHFVKSPIEYFARYPATLYSLEVPSELFARAFGLNSTWNGARLVNILAPVVWLFALRPLLFGRSTSPAWILPATYVLFNREFLYFFDSVYLEAWPAVLTLTALEALFDRRQPMWLAPFVAGCACTFKDTAILPFMAIGAAALWRSRRTPTGAAAILAAGTLSVFPFILYYVERRSSGVWRTLRLSSFADAWTSERLANAWFRTLDQFGWTGMLALLTVIAVGLTYALSPRGRDRGAAVLVVLGGLVQFPIFFFDRISLPWPGYPRFWLIPWLMMITPVYLLPRRAVIGLTLVLGLGLSPKVIERLTELNGASYQRNFSEDYGTPVYVPFRALLTRAQPRLRTGQTIRWIRGFGGVNPAVFPLVYHDLYLTYRWESYGPDAAEETCRCAPGVALLISTHASRHLHANMPHVPYSVELNQMSAACRDAVERTCECITEGDPIEGRLCTNR